ncbi:hypothetical protein [Dyadobacter frigoris]|uniref:Uncharacterized protein n=1 Tax=Dyadobacter frigoris TaxID=2576211 RepID=A0A4U6CPE3_9BACT|nr:hypothetical protein [Dyadobacter frigoris]TKT85247.1 hypothetical protein FDK13_34205 [Dyadobacter frigoris]
MSVNTRAILPMLWLLASEHADPTSGIVDQSIKSISFRLRLTEKEIQSAIDEAEKCGFIMMLSTRNETVTEPLPNRTPRDREETEERPSRI